MIYFTIRILPLIFFCVNSLTYHNFNWEDLSSECGTTSYNNTNFAHSHSSNNLARIGEFPWLARIGLYEEDTNKLFFYCTGSLIHKDYVITAAHCGKHGVLNKYWFQLNNIAKFSFSVRLGEINLESAIDCYFGTCAPPPQDIKIKETIFAQHCRITNTNDISIVVLENPAIINDFVRPICFPQQPIPHYELMDEVLIAAGWGVMYSGWGTVHGSDFGPIKDLKEVFSFVLDSGYCDNLYKRDLQESELCVKYEEGVMDTCVVDSGGPLVRYVGVEKRAYIVGIASHDLILCYVGQGSAVIYTDVSHFAEWVLMRINQWIKWGA